MPTILVCGDRDWTDKAAILRELLRYGDSDTIVIEGGSRGADILAREVAMALDYMVITYPALWQEEGKAAGPLRNQRMLDKGKPDMVLAFHPNIDRSKGTKDMVLRATRAGIPVHIIDR